MSDDNDEIIGECPCCGADVGYDEWMECNLEGHIACPQCGLASEVDDVYPPA